MTGSDYPPLDQPLRWILTYYNPYVQHSDDSSTLGLLLADRGNTIKNMTTPMTRTTFRQQLQKQQLEQQDHLLQAQNHTQTEQSPNINVPRTASPATLPPDVPSSVLQVRNIFCSF